MEIEVIDNEKITNETASNLLTFISSAFDYDFPNIGNAKYRFIHKVNDQIVGHVALDERIISINNKKYRVLFLGQFCVKKSDRSKGYGKKILSYVKEYNFNNYYDLILLNCGKEITDFYMKSGFFKISSSAEYLRFNGIETDYDPVLCFILNQDIIKKDLLTENILLGKDL